MAVNSNREEDPDIIRVISKNEKLSESTDEEEKLAVDIEI